MSDYYISTIDEQAGDLARRYGLGIEFVEFCTAWNMDEWRQEAESSIKWSLSQKNAKLRKIDDCPSSFFER